MALLCREGMAKIQEAWYLLPGKVDKISYLMSFEAMI